MDKTKECFDKLTAVLRGYDLVTAMDAAMRLLAHIVSNIAVGEGWLGESQSEREQDAADLTAKLSQLVEDHAHELIRRKEAAPESDEPKGSS